jgi:Transposase
LVERCAGFDVHRDSVVATVRVPAKRRRQREQHTRRFGATIAQLESLSEWLAGFGVTLVAMEATGVYWRPVFHVLEPRFRCWLLNAQHLRNVPGRKSDVIDSAWILKGVKTRFSAEFELTPFKHICATHSSYFSATRLEGAFVVAAPAGDRPPHTVAAGSPTASRPSPLRRRSRTGAG